MTDTVNASTIAPELRGRVFRKLLIFIMPAVLIAFMDRVDISYAAPTMNPAIGINPATFGLGAGVFFLGYMLLEIPSNMIMARVGARFWLSRIMIAWGLVSAGMSLVSGPSSFLALRFLLGVAEAGFLPGIMLYASYWVSTRELGVFNSLMLLMIPIASSATALVSGMILHLDGWLGFAGWQWIFILEALPAVLLGLLGLIYLPNRPRDARWLSNAEKTQVELWADGTVPHAAHHWGAEVMMALRNRDMWILALAYFAMNFALGAQPWLPLLLAPFHLSGIVLGGALAIANACAAGAMLVWGRRSDRRGDRRGHLVLAAVLSAAGWILCGNAETSLGLILLGTTLALVGLYAALVVFWTIPTVFLSVAERPVGIALITCVGLIASFVAPTVTGWLKQATGSYQLGMYLAAAGILSTALCVWVQQSAAKRIAGAPDGDGLLRRR
jgi:ACS family tartrate transporter-like MFS transporter